MITSLTYRVSVPIGPAVILIFPLIQTTVHDLPILRALNVITDADSECTEREHKY